MHGHDEDPWSRGERQDVGKQLVAEPVWKGEVQGEEIHGVSPKPGKHFVPVADDVNDLVVRTDAGAEPFHHHRMVFYEKYPHVECLKGEVESSDPRQTPQPSRG